MQTEELELYSEQLLDTVSANVKKYREKKGFTQMQLALEIGMNGGAELRKKNHHFNIRHIAKIAKVLEIDICELLKENNHR